MQGSLIRRPMGCSMRRMPSRSNIMSREQIAAAMLTIQWMSSRKQTPQQRNPCRSMLHQKGQHSPGKGSEKVQVHKQSQQGLQKHQLQIRAQWNRTENTESSQGLQLRWQQRQSRQSRWRLSARTRRQSAASCCARCAPSLRASCGCSWRCLARCNANLWVNSCHSVSWA